MVFLIKHDKHLVVGRGLLLMGIRCLRPHRWRVGSRQKLIRGWSIRVWHGRRGCKDLIPRHGNCWM